LMPEPNAGGTGPGFAQPLKCVSVFISAPLPVELPPPFALAFVSAGFQPNATRRG